MRLPAPNMLLPSPFCVLVCVAFVLLFLVVLDPTGCSSDVTSLVCGCRSAEAAREIKARSVAQWDRPGQQRLD